MTTQLSPKDILSALTMPPSAFSSCDGSLPPVEFQPSRLISTSRFPRRPIRWELPLEWAFRFKVLPAAEHWTIWMIDFSRPRFYATTSPAYRLSGRLITLKSTRLERQTRAEIGMAHVGIRFKT